jgi:hypothetical protein
MEGNFMKALVSAPEYLGRPRVAARYGKCTRTIKRWKKLGIIPPPDLVLPNGTEFWKQATLDANDREMTAAAAAKSTAA